MLVANNNAGYATAFMKSIFQRCKPGDGFINLRFLAPQGGAKNEWIKNHEVVKKLPSILASYQKYNCFFAVALRQEKRGDKNGITKIPTLWCDVDSKKYDAKKAKEFSVRFKKFPLKPSFVVKSGGGLHLYWKLHTPVFAKEIPKIEELNKRLAAYFLADPSACEAARVMRIPGTRNLKYDLKPIAEISTEFSDGNRAYTLETLDHMIPPLRVLPSKEINGGLPTSRDKPLLQGVNEGERNSALTKIAGSLIAHHLLKDAVIFFTRAWNEKNNPPLPDSELLTTIDSIWKKHHNRNPEHEQEDTANSPDLKMTTIREVFDYPEPSFLIDQLLPEGTVSVLGGYTGTGKSLVALSMIKGILTGEPLWRHFRVKKRGAVLLIDEETPDSFLKERLKKMGFHEDLPLSLLHFQSVRLDADSCLENLKTLVKEIKPLLIVIDSLIRVHRKKEDDAAEMSRVMDALRKLANLGTTIIVVHHHRKGDGPMNQKLRGSSDISGGIDIEFSLVPRDGFLLFSSVKTRTKPFQPIRLKLEANNGRIELVYEGDQLAKNDQILNAIVSLLPQHGEMSISQIAASLKQSGMKVGEKNLRSILSSASGKRLIEKPGGKGKKLYRLNPAWQFGNSKKKEKLPR